MIGESGMFCREKLWNTDQAFLSQAESACHSSNTATADKERKAKCEI